MRPFRGLARSSARGSVLGLMAWVLWLTLTGVILVSNSVCAEQSVLKLFPQAGELEKVFVLDGSDLTDAESLLVASLAGLAVDSPVGIYIAEGRTYTLWLGQIRDSGIPVELVFSLDELIQKIRGLVDVQGYIRTRLGTPAVNAATSLAALKRAALVDESLLSRAKAWGWKEIADSRGMDDAAAWRAGQGGFASHVLFQQAPDKWHLRDAIIGSGAYVFYGASDALYAQVSKHVPANTPLLGWGSGPEDGHVGWASRHGLRTVPADWCVNLSVLGRFQLDRLAQKTSTPENPSYEPNVHYVTFVMSDGDNIQWLLGNNFAEDYRYFGSPFRGRFPMGWQFSPGLIDAAPLEMKWFYENAKNDEFVMGVSGTGYFFPSCYPDAALQEQVRQLAGAIARTDLRLVCVLDKAPLHSSDFKRVARAYSSIPGLEGVIYLNYADYAGGRGRVLWVDDVPIVSARFKLWDGNPVQLAETLNRMPCTPDRTDGYSIVSVHPWSHGLHDVAKVVENLDDHVRVVLPSELFARMKAHVDR